jgi:hypothetical protein
MLISFPVLGQTQANNAASLGLEHPIIYTADDSIVTDIPNQIIKLYGNSKVTYDDVELNASIIEIDLKNNEVSAYYSYDSTGAPKGKPIFVQAGEEMKCDQLKYNFKTKQGFITEIRLQRDEGYIHMAESKIHPNDEIHFKNGKYTTCDKEEPHYYFKLSKAMIIPDKRIVTGPLYMKLLKIPLPLAAPFAIFPNTDKHTHGVVLSEMRFSLASTYGTGIEKLGYYIPINNNVETFFYGSIYTTGRWGISNQTNYLKKYKHAGQIGIEYEHLSGYFFEEVSGNSFNVLWRHVQDPKAHPSIKFNSDVNFRSNNNPKNSLTQIADNYFQNQINSSVTLSKNWRIGTKFTGGWNFKNSLRQNVTAKTFTLDLPAFNLNVSRFDLGVLRKQKIGKKWYENIAVTYALNAQNQIITPDSIFNPQYFSQLKSYAKNGIKQNVVVQTNLKPKNGIFNFNLSSTYNEYWNFQTIEESWNSNQNKVDSTLQNGLATTRTINFSGGLTSNLYGYFKSANESVKARHVMSPQISFTYKPDIGAHQAVQIDSLGNTAFYSPFDVSLYKEPTKGESGLISFSIGNTLELKYLDKKDTINKTYKKLRLIDAFSVGGGYDVFKDSMNLSDFTFSLRSSPIKFINLQSSWRLSPYAWDSIGSTTKNYAWDEGKGLGRISIASATLTTKLANKKKPNNKLDSNSVFNDLPWQANFSYNIKYTRTQNGIVQIDTFDILQTLRWDGFLGINKNWRFDYGLNIDLQKGELSALNLGIWRNLHCWEAGLTWRQTGHGDWGKDFSNNIYWDPPKNYYLALRVNIKANMFDAFLPEQNLKIPPNW